MRTLTHGRQRTLDWIRVTLPDNGIPSLRPELAEGLGLSAVSLTSGHSAVPVTGDRSSCVGNIMYGIWVSERATLPPCGHGRRLPWARGSCGETPLSSAGLPSVDCTVASQWSQC